MHYSYVKAHVLFAFLTILPAIASTQNITPSTPSLDPYDLTGVSCSSQGLSAVCVAGGACCADNTCCGVGLQCVKDSSTGGYGCEASKTSSDVNAPSISFQSGFSFLPSFFPSSNRNQRSPGGPGTVKENVKHTFTYTSIHFKQNRADTMTTASHQASPTATTKTKNSPANWSDLRHRAIFLCRQGNRVLRRLGL